MASSGPNRAHSIAPVAQSKTSTVEVSTSCENIVEAKDLNKGEMFYPLRAFVCSECWLIQVHDLDLSGIMVGGTVPDFTLQSGDTLVVPALSEGVSGVPASLVQAYETRLAALTERGRDVAALLAGIPAVEHFARGAGDGVDRPAAGMDLFDEACSKSPSMGLRPC